MKDDGEATLTGSPAVPAVWLAQKRHRSETTAPLGRNRLNPGVQALYSMTVPADRENLMPPIGAGPGLPYTTIWADVKDDSGSNADHALFDTALWMPKNPAVVTASGTQLITNPQPGVPQIATGLLISATGTPRLDIANFGFPGMTSTVSCPTLNFEQGFLAFGQAQQDISAGRHATDPADFRNALPASTFSITEVGRYVSHPRAEYASARPGNNTWSQFGFKHRTHGAQFDMCPAYDMSLGLRQAEGSELLSNRTLGVVEAIAHHTHVDMPSNGFGASYGDCHNSLYKSTLFSCPLQELGGQVAGYTSSYLGAPVYNPLYVTVESQNSAHWGINLAVRQPTLSDGLSLSSPMATPAASTSAAENTNLFAQCETIQTVNIYDRVSLSGVAAVNGVRTLGRADLGNFAVKDSCGLIGYEGVFMVSAFLNVSADTDNGVTPTLGTLNNDGTNTFAGINVQVHSGLPLKRNGMAWNDPTGTTTEAGKPFIVYGTDGDGVKPISEMLSTDAIRSAETGQTALTEGSNRTLQHTGRTYSEAYDGASAAPGVVTYPFQQQETHSMASSGVLSNCKSWTSGYDGTIVGDPHDPTTKFVKTTHLTPSFMADKIPTKVKVVPVMVGFEDVVVAPGATKLSSYPSAGNLTFRKPIVDYHVLVSLSDRTRLQVRAKEGGLGNGPYGLPTERNNPLPEVLCANLNLEDEPCYIYHAIFRIDPDTLEQVHYDPALCTWLDPDGGEMSDTVIPRGYTLDSAPSGFGQGWGLHQLTPFRPIANISWNKVPRLCAAIEAGGTYQRGGISHLWDADAYGEELFVCADIIDTTDIVSSSTKDGKPFFGPFGRGQVWPIGSHSVTAPQGSELLVFRYDPQRDPFYMKGKTTVTANPIYELFSNMSLPSGSYGSLTALQCLRPPRPTAYGIDGSTGTTWADITHFYTVISIRAGLALPTSNIGLAKTTLVKNDYTWPGWEIHDWVFPQIELMRYLGREDKSFARSPHHSGNTASDPIYHPTLHCSSLRIMEDGRMMMAAIHRDYIGSEDEYPSSEISYPFNPDVDVGGCPPGYYQSGNECLPILNNFADDPDGTHTDPTTGEQMPGNKPNPVSGSGQGSVPQSDNFSLYPTWSRIIANTSGRSLILMWTEAKAEGGKIPKAGAEFDVTWVRADGSDFARQSWVIPAGHWWSGSRISYWYPESGQRAIPITYGSYPEARCSYASLPKTLPHLHGTTPVVKCGYPLKQPIETISPFPGRAGLDTRPLAGSQAISSWMTDRWNYLRETVFVPTTIGFADFGAGMSPFQEKGWSGWSVPRGLLDGVNYGDNSVFFSDDPLALSVNYGQSITPNLISTQGNFVNFGRGAGQVGLLGGPRAFWSHHGPLNYGVSGIHHPYRVDKVWKQTNGGVGYDLPLHLLAPGSVNVRARAGSRNSLDLEMETPFHRTDTIQVSGGELFNTGFDLGGESTPGATRTSLGQYYLRTNLWDNQARTNAGTAKVTGLQSFQRVRGPIISGDSLSAWWTDHPTDHFHAGAMPIFAGSDFDLAFVESNRYAPAMLARSDEFNRLDMVAASEQLMSSVDVHISQAVKPMWDSGSIVSAQGMGPADEVYGAYAPTDRSEMKGGATMPTTTELTTTVWDDGLGKGQRVVRTPEGTLHMFSIRRGAKTAGTHYPCWTHFTKPLYGDLFWNRKSKKPSPDQVNYDGKDEVAVYATTSQKLMGASFASDSNGTIHAVIEVAQFTGSVGSATQRSHILYYTYAERKVVTANPDPVYEWDWSAHTPVGINPGGAAGENDLRQPSLVCDSHDRLHLVCQSVVKADIPTGGTEGMQYIVYTTKLQNESSFTSYPSTTTLSGTIDSRWQVVSKPYSNLANDENSETAFGNDATEFNSHPKVCLRGDNIPFVFWLGSCPNVTASEVSDRKLSAVYVNNGSNPTGVNDASGHFSFNQDNCQAVINGQTIHGNYAVKYYDAIIDSRNRAVVVAIKNAGGPPVEISTFDCNKPLVDQYVAGSAPKLGNNKILFQQKVSGSLLSEADYEDVTMTVNGDGELHMIFAFSLSGTIAGSPDYLYSGETFRLPGTKESAIAPLQWGATPAPTFSSPPTAGNSYGGGYKRPSGGVVWNTGGTHGTSLYSGPRRHFMQVYAPSFEFDGLQNVVRSVNIRWLSVPSLGWDATDKWFPTGSAQTMAGQEDFQHTNPQLRYQRFWGYDASELDLKWATNELAWYRTGHGQATIFFPDGGGITMTVGENRRNGDGIASYPNGS
jgi:hypothetical protein